jgi:hypothetical protein
MHGNEAGKGQDERHLRSWAFIEVIIHWLTTAQTEKKTHLR